jgi:uncharacterized membrane protein (Fun14 family)
MIDQNLISTLLGGGGTLGFGALGIGAIVGYTAGWLARKVLKIAIIIIGLILAIMAYLEAQKTITVNWNVASNQTNVILHSLSVKMLHLANTVGADLNNHAAAFPILGVTAFVPSFAFGFIRG